MASVFLALDGAAFQKLIAIKVVHSHLSAAPSAVRMFIDEARIVAAINHPNVCQMLDFGEQDGRHYLAMEYLSGEPLSSVLRKTAGIPGVLIEPTYISEPSQARLLKTDKFRQAEARSIAKAIQQYLRTNDQGTGYQPPLSRGASDPGGGGTTHDCTDPKL